MIMYAPSKKTATSLRLCELARAFIDAVEEHAGRVVSKLGIELDDKLGNHCEAHRSEIIAESMTVNGRIWLEDVDSIARRE